MRVDCRGFQVVLLVKLGIIRVLSRKAWSAGALNQDYMWETEVALLGQYRMVRRLLQEGNDKLGKVRQVVVNLVGEQGLEIVR